MKLTVVGCSGSYPAPGNSSSCYLVEHEGVAIVLDLGNGSFGQLQRHIDIADDNALSAVLISHLHADHYIDLTAMSVARGRRPCGPMPLLPVYGPSSWPDVVKRPAFELQQLRDTTIGPFSIRVARVAHPGESYAIRVEAGGRSLVYSGDTGPCNALIDLARDADLALFEAAWTEPDDKPHPVDLHLTAREAAQHARRANVGSLVLTHLSPWVDRDASEDQARSAWEGPLRIAEPGFTIEV